MVLVDPATGSCRTTGAGTGAGPGTGTAERVEPVWDLPDEEDWMLAPADLATDSCRTIVTVERLHFVWVPPVAAASVHIAHRPGKSVPEQEPECVPVVVIAETFALAHRRTVEGTGAETAKVVPVAAEVAASMSEEERYMTARTARRTWGLSCHSHRSHIVHSLDHILLARRVQTSGLSGYSKIVEAHCNRSAGRMP